MLPTIISGIRARARPILTSICLHSVVKVNIDRLFQDKESGFKLLAGI